ncbi:nucleotidyl transferase AbiEii/AbiGii toxin family protein [candidate division KSB1 bacterium]|nr:nucleotidyl transferase AbiEii/AbiGii toxin family protein [candidate division KSB1 bacterium]
MHSAVKNMLEKYNCQTVNDYKNALKEILQEIALLGFFRTGFFNHAAFYGGTALRIFYGLDRYSEDLDFSLLEPDPDFSIKPYCDPLQEELAAYGFSVDVSRKNKKESQVESAFIKGETLIHLLQIESIEPPVAGVNPGERLKIKLEIDIDPPARAEYEIKYALAPVPFSVRLFTSSCLFAGKVHALLCRNWKTRIKGRDLYDYVWYLSQAIPLNLPHLAERMRQTGHLGSSPLTEKEIQKRLYDRFELLDFRQAKIDIRPFIADQRALDLWSKDFFQQITKNKLLVDT